MYLKYNHLNIIFLYYTRVFHFKFRFSILFQESPLSHLLNQFYSNTPFLVGFQHHLSIPFANFETLFWKNQQCDITMWLIYCDLNKKLTRLLLN